MQCHNKTLFGVMLVAALAGLPLVYAHQFHWPTVRQLPTTASIGPSDSDGFRLHRATSHDLAGQSTHGIPAWQVTESVSQMGWARGAPAPPPAFVLKGSARLRSEIALFQGANGWMAVPLGWHLVSAGVGMTGGGNVLKFAAPRGASYGWVAYYNAGVGIGSVLGAADGLFPGAHHRFDAFIHARTPEETLSPKPDSLRYPNRCTLLVAYRSGPLTVKGIALRPWVDAYDPTFTSFFVALPKKDARLQKFLIAAFQASQTLPGSFCPASGYRPPKS